MGHGKNRPIRRRPPPPDLGPQLVVRVHLRCDPLCQRRRSAGIVSIVFILSLLFQVPPRRQKTPRTLPAAATTATAAAYGASSLICVPYRNRGCLRADSRFIAPSLLHFVSEIRNKSNETDVAAAAAAASSGEIRRRRSRSPQQQQQQLTVAVELRKRTGADFARAQNKKKTNEKKKRNRPASEPETGGATGRCRLSGGS